MCFRPADVTQAQVCPNCGKKLPMKEGLKLKKCPFCKSPLGDEVTTIGGPSAPAAPGAPKAPGAPAAPKAPQAPEAPGAPQKPNAAGGQANS